MANTLLTPAVIEALAKRDLAALAPDCTVSFTAHPLHENLLHIYHRPADKNVTVPVNAADLTMTPEQFSARIIAPMVKALSDSVAQPRA